MNLTFGETSLGANITHCKSTIYKIQFNCKSQLYDINIYKKTMLFEIELLMRRQLCMNWNMGVPLLRKVWVLLWGWVWVLSWGAPVPRLPDLPSAMGRSLASRSNPSVGVDHISLWIRCMSKTTHCPQSLANISTLSSNFQILVPTQQFSSVPTGAVDFWKAIFPLFQNILLLDFKTLNSQLIPNLLCSAAELQRGSVTTIYQWSVGKSSVVPSSG